MPQRIVLYDSLYSLYIGDELYCLPNTEGYFGYRLEHCREVYVVFDELLENGYIELKEKAEHIETYRITNKGLEAFYEGTRWYCNLPWYKKLLGRCGFPFDFLP